MLGKSIIWFGMFFLVLSLGFVAAENFAFQVKIEGNFSGDSIFGVEDDYNILSLSVEEVYLYDFETIMYEDDGYNDTIKIRTLDLNNEVLNEYYFFTLFDSNVSIDFVSFPYSSDVQYVKFYNTGRELLEFDLNELCDNNAVCSGYENVYFCSDCDNESLDNVCMSVGGILDGICDPDCLDEDCVNSFIDEEGYGESNCVNGSYAWNETDYVWIENGMQAYDENWNTAVWCINGACEIYENYNYNNNFLNAGIVFESKAHCTADSFGYANYYCYDYSDNVYRLFYHQELSTSLENSFIREVIPYYCLKEENNVRIKIELIKSENSHPVVPILYYESRINYYEEPGASGQEQIVTVPITGNAIEESEEEKETKDDNDRGNGKKDKKEKKFDDEERRDSEEKIVLNSRAKLEKSWKEKILYFFAKLFKVSF